MATKHLATGAAQPALEADTLRLYSMRFCPFSQRVRLVLAHKHIKHEVVNLNLIRKPDWLFELHPMGMSPILQYNDKIVYESGITCEYLDEAYPEKPLYPRDPYAKARVKMLMEHWGKVVPKFFIIRKVSGDELKSTLAEMHQLLQIFEKELMGKEYFGGSSPNMLDLHTWPLVERVPDVNVIFPKETHPNLQQWSLAMRKVPAVKAILETQKTHQAFIDAYLNEREPEYDMEPIPE